MKDCEDDMALLTISTVTIFSRCSFSIRRSALFETTELGESETWTVRVSVMLFISSETRVNDFLLLKDRAWTKEHRQKVCSLRYRLLRLLQQTKSHTTRSTLFQNVISNEFDM